jgi:hypothetical protein
MRDAFLLHAVLQVTDGAGNRLDFSKGRYLELDQGIIAAPPAVHGALVSALKQINNAVVESN